MIFTFILPSKIYLYTFFKRPKDFSDRQFLLAVILQQPPTKSKLSSSRISSKLRSAYFKVLKNATENGRLIGSKESVLLRPKALFFLK